MRLVELHPGLRRARRDRLELGRERLELFRYAQAKAAAAGAPGIGVRLAGRQCLPCQGRQADGPSPVDNAALAQLVADGSHDRHRQLGHPGDLAGRNRLAAGHGHEHVADS